MEALYRAVSGIATGIALLVAPIGPPVGCLLLFMAAEFATGVAADRVQARRAGRPWHFDRTAPRRTAVKALLAVTTLLLCSLAERFVLGEADAPRMRLVAGFACGIELWSFLGHAARISEAPLFRELRDYGLRAGGKGRAPEGKRSE